MYTVVCALRNISQAVNAVEHEPNECVVGVAVMWPQGGANEADWLLWSCHDTDRC